MPQSIRIDSSNVVSYGEREFIVAVVEDIEVIDVSHQAKAPVAQQDPQLPRQSLIHFTEIHDSSKKTQPGMVLDGGKTTFAAIQQKTSNELRIRQRQGFVRHTFHIRNQTIDVDRTKEMRDIRLDAPPVFTRGQLQRLAIASVTTAIMKPLTSYVP